MFAKMVNKSNNKLYIPLQKLGKISTDYNMDFFK